LCRGLQETAILLYLVVEQLLEIIFTFFTVNVGCDPDEEPPGVDALDPAPLLGLVAEPPLSLPMMRT
jgi:hypothetical protein